MATQFNKYTNRQNFKNKLIAGVKLKDAMLMDFREIQE